MWLIELYAVVVKGGKMERQVMQCGKYFDCKRKTERWKTDC